MAVKINNIEIPNAWVVPFSPRQIKLIPWKEQITLEPPPCEEALRKAGLNIVESITGEKFIVRCNSLAGFEEEPPQVSVSANRESVKIGEYIYLYIDIRGSAILSAVDNGGNTFFISESQVIYLRAKPIYDKYVFVYRKCYNGTDAGIDKVEVAIELPSASIAGIENKLSIRINGCTRLQAQFLYSLLGQSVLIEDDDGNTYAGKVIAVDLQFIASDVNPFKFPADIYTGTVEVLL